MSFWGGPLYSVGLLVQPQRPPVGQEQGPSEAHSPNQLTAGTCRHSATFLIPLKANTNNDIGTSASFGTESENCFINHMFRMRFTVNIWLTTML